MQKKEFDLLEEPWIRVITPSLEQKEVSLMDALIHAHEYMGLSGEMATQDAAILRVLLAVAVTIFYRYDPYGEEMELSEEDDSDEEDVLERWKGYWEAGRFSEQVIRDYLGRYKERFWLFHPETPFWQVKDLQYGTDYGVECLLGNMKESMNTATKRHFSMTDGEGLHHLSYGETARWLVHLNAYAVNLKTKKEAPGTTLPVGTGRLGQLGFVMINGDDLFQTLMLNLCALDNDGGLWGAPKPTWEQEVCREQSRKVGTPEDLPDRYTIQSRRILLKRDPKGEVIGFRALGGDFFSVEDDTGEPMTIWKQKRVDKKTGEELPAVPQIHDPAVHAWREFPTLLSAKNGKNGEITGVVRWVDRLCSEKAFVPDTLITFRMIGMVYGDKMNYTYGDHVDDTLTISAGLLNDLNSTDRAWITCVSEQIEKCQSVARDALYHFADKASKFLYGNDSMKGNIKDRLTRHYYFSIDAPFRVWLMSLDPTERKREEKVAEWERQSYHYARRTVEDHIATWGTDRYIYREEVSKEGKRFMLTVPKIMSGYLSELGKIYVRERNAM